MKTLTSPARAAVTLVEMMIAATISLLALGAVYTGAISMHRCFAASLDFADAKKEQARLSDYVALDLRRANKVTLGGADGLLLTLSMQDYYDEEGQPRTPTITKYVHHYGDPNKPMIVRYMRGGPCIYRQVLDQPPLQVARNILDFQVSAENDGRLVHTAITFAPRYGHDPAAGNQGAALATTVRSTTFLRNTYQNEP